MKTLIGVLSCHALRHYEQTIRETWGKDVPAEVDLRFFLGTKPPEKGGFDEVLLDVPDDFSGITEKTLAMFRWAEAYAYVWKMDLDTFVRPVQLLSSGLDQFDYVGGPNEQGVVFASGGAGYGLSRKALGHVLSFPATKGPAEDVNTALALQAAGISLHTDPRFKYTPGQTLESGDLTMHLSSVVAWDTKYRPEWMHEAYAARGSYRPQGPVAPVAQKRTFRRLR
jgi:hypothetical protein